jgi:hypothetical protein
LDLKIELMEKESVDVHLAIIQDESLKGEGAERGLAKGEKGNPSPDGDTG